MRHENEYTALREELLALVDKAFDVWKWSLAAIFAVAGAILLAAFGESQILTKFVTQRPWLLPSVLFGTIAAIIYELTKMLADLEETRDRLGGYVAVFHDQELPVDRLDRRRFGWHVWNRLEHHVPSLLRRPPRGAKRRHYVFTRRLHAYTVLMLLFTMFVFALATVASNQWRWEAAVVGVVLTIPVGIRMSVLESRGQSGLVYWTLRWRELLALDDQALSAALNQVGLFPMAPSVPEPAGLVPTAPSTDDRAAAQRA